MYVEGKIMDNVAVVCMVNDRKNYVAQYVYIILGHPVFETAALPNNISISIPVSVWV